MEINKYCGGEIHYRIAEDLTLITFDGEDYIDLVSDYPDIVTLEELKDIDPTAKKGLVSITINKEDVLAMVKVLMGMIED